MTTLPDPVSAALFQPITAPPPAPTPPPATLPPAPRRVAASISQDEQRRRTKATRAKRMETGVSPQTGPAEKSRKRPPHLTEHEALSIVSDIARANHQVASETGPETRGADRKHSAVAVGVAVDKWLAIKRGPSNAQAEKPTGSAAAVALASRLLSRQQQ